MRFCKRLGVFSLVCIVVSGCLGEKKQPTPEEIVDAALAEAEPPRWTTLNQFTLPFVDGSIEASLDDAMMPDSAPVEPQARVLINELNANLADGCDLIELYVVEAGSLSGWKVLERTTEILSFAGLELMAGDFVVVHLNGNQPLCNPSSSENETSGPDEFLNAMYAANYDTAYDWYSEDEGLVATDNAITIQNALGDIVDAVLVSDDVSGTAATDSETQAARLAEAGQWLTVEGYVPSGGFVDETFNANAVQDLNATGTHASGPSILRLTLEDTHTLSDWSTPATQTNATWAAPNFVVP